MRKCVIIVLLISFSLACIAQENNASFTNGNNERHPTKQDGEITVIRDVSSPFILNGRLVEAVPIANGCGTEDGLGRFLGRTGAAVDAALNTNPELAIIPLTLPSVAAAHALLNSEEYQRINNEICGIQHDVPYYNGASKTSTDYNLWEGGAYITGLAVILSGPLPKIGSDAAYRKARQEAEQSRILEQELRELGEILPPGYFLREKPIQNDRPISSSGNSKEGGHNLNALVNTIFLFDDSIRQGEFVATEDDGFVYVRLNPSDLGRINMEFIEAISSLKRTNTGFDGNSRPIRRREEVVPSTPRINRGLQ